MTSSQLGIVAEGEDGEPETVLQPESSGVVVEPGVEDVDGFAATVEESNESLEGDLAPS